MYGHKVDISKSAKYAILKSLFSYINIKIYIKLNIYGVAAHGHGYEVSISVGWLSKSQISFSYVNIKLNIIWWATYEYNYFTI